MTRLLFKFSFLVFFIPSFVFSKWEEYDLFGKVNLYIDFDTIKYSADNVYVETLMDLPSRDRTGFISIYLKQEINCEKTAMRVIKQKYYEDNMGKGEIIKVSSRIMNWVYPPENSSYGIMISEFCKK